jgi:centractin
MAVNTRLHNAPIVLDNGSGTIRAGFAGEDVPKCYFPSYVGRPKHVRTMAGARDGDVFIGPLAQELRGLLKINYPLEHGIVTHWEDMERIWQYVYNEGLKTIPEDVCCEASGIDQIPFTKPTITASCPTHRTAIESTIESRYRRPDSV